MPKRKIIEENSIEEIKKQDDNRYRLKIDNTSRLSKTLKIEQIINEHYFEVIMDEEEIAQFIKKLIEKDIKVYEVNKEELTLEEAFIKKAGGKKID